MNAVRPRLSVVCPVYQEEASLPYFHAELVRVLEGLRGELDFEIIYVEDGSPDRTRELLRRMAAADARVRYLFLSRNFGHQASLLAGLRNARGDIVLMMDADLQHPPALIPELLRRWREGADVVITIREYDRSTGRAKRFLSTAFYSVMRHLSRTEIRQSAADFRLMTRRALNALLELRDAQLFLRGMVEWVGFPTAEVPFVAPPRQAGRSKYTLGRQLDLAIDGMLSFSHLPLRLSLTLGLMMLLLGIVSGGIFFVRWLGGYHGGAQMGLFLCVECFIGGAILVGLGIVGEYVGRIFEQVQGRPQYFIQEAGNMAAEDAEVNRNSASRCAA